MFEEARKARERGGEKVCVREKRKDKIGREYVRVKKKREKVYVSNAVLVGKRVCGMAQLLYTVARMQKRETPLRDTYSTVPTVCPLQSKPTLLSATASSFQAVQRGKGYIYI